MRALFVSLLLLGLVAPEGRSEELLTPGEELLRELRTALRKGDEKAAVGSLRRLAALYRWPASEEEARALLGAAGEAALSKSPLVARTAIRALGETRAAGAAFHLVGHLQTLKPAAEQVPIVVEALGAAGRTASGIVLPKLVQFMKDSPNLVLAEQAALAAGGLSRGVKADRMRAADRVLQAALSLRRNRKRWRRLEAPVLRALQRLCGRRLNTVELFDAWWRAARKRPDPFAK